MGSVDPLKKDTVYIFGIGYVVLRVEASNTGLWLLHCYILWHKSIGMGKAFEGGHNDEIWKSLSSAARESRVG